MKNSWHIVTCPEVSYLGEGALGHTALLGPIAPALAPCGFSPHLETRLWGRFLGTPLPCAPHPTPSPQASNAGASWRAGLQRRLSSRDVAHVLLE